MSDVVVPSGGEKGKVALPKAKAVKVVLKKKAATVLELRDSFFHDGSAIMLPADPAGPPDDKKKLYSSLEIIKAAFIYMRENPKKRLVITGHSDKAGGETKDNFKLSKLMADAVYALIKGVKAGWIQAVKNANNVEDHKYIIKYYFGKYKLGQDPGDINSTVDDKSKKAVKKFKKDYNKMFGRVLVVDENINDEFWGAIFDVYMKELAELLGAKDADDLANFRKNIAFVIKDDEPKNIFGCAESIPLDLTNVTGLESKKQGRVVLLFFDSDKMTSHNIICPPNKDKPHKLKICPFYNNTIKAVVLDPAKIFGKGPIIAITKLDKWFIPGPTGAGKDGEECQFEVELAGRKGMATQFAMDVYGSNYCDVTRNENGTLTFKKVESGIPVYHDVWKDPVESGKKYNHDDYKWSGGSNAASGMLKPAEGKQRYINAAFSPYTVHFRWYRDDAGKDAQIELFDFWPQWEKDGANWKPVNDSLKIKWKISKYKKLKLGELIIFDRTDTKVFIKELKEADLSEGDHDFQWDGTLKDATKMKKSEMPYRVQIHGHSDGEEPKGVALAAMHTEVRLYADPDTNKNAKPDEYKDPNSLKFSIAPFVTEKPKKDTEENKWYQYILAMQGYHPGPVDGIIGTMTTRAIREFQRSVPANNARPYTRLEVTGGKNNATKAALERFEPPNVGPVPLPLRALFGNPEHANLIDIYEANVNTRLNDTTKKIIVWFDGRHYYTKRWEFYNLNSLLWHGPAGGPIPFRDRPIFMRNYHGKFSCKDDLVRLNRRAISRPRIPVMVDLPLRPRDTVNHGLKSKLNKINDTSRNAIGPLRIDWSFTEIGEDLSGIADTLAGAANNYNKLRTRSNKYIETMVGKYSDTIDLRKYSNCPDKIKEGVKTITLGGIRIVKGNANATDVDKYFEVLFGRNGGSLYPWPAKSDSDRKTVFTLIHDNVGQDEKKLHADFVGKAGIFLCPSIIAGDGYRFRAQVCFDEFPGNASQFPNMEVLKRRYEQIPQAHTSGVRMWRKTSLRGYLGWCPPARKQWGGANDIREDFIKMYRPAFTHYVHDGVGNPAPPVEHNLADLMAQNVYNDMVRRKISTMAHYGAQTRTLNNQYLWPFCNEPHLGFRRSALGANVNNYIQNEITPKSNEIWLKIAEDLILYLISRIEKRESHFLKGHFIVQMDSSPRINFEQGRCPVCGRNQIEVTNNVLPANKIVGNPCPIGCNNALGNPQNMVLAGGWNIPSLGFSSLGLPLGGIWVNHGRSELWAHEIGHCRHLEHSRSWPGANITTTKGTPGGANGATKQHDVSLNTRDLVLNPAPAPPPPPPIIDKDRCWDRCCTMGYNDVERQFFCGKCILRNRGWAVEDLTDPASGVFDA